MVILTFINLFIMKVAITSYAARHASSFLLVNSEGTAGVESGSIKDDQMKSSNHPNDRHPANEGRLNGPGAWCGNPSQNKLYLQIDFEWNFEGTYLHALERFQLLPLLDTDVTGKISIGNYTVREVLMKNRTRVWQNVYNNASA